MWSRLNLILSVAFSAFLANELHAQEGAPGFRRFEDTISPDGQFVLAWGWGEDEHPENLKEWPAEADTVSDAVANYLVDTRRAKVLAVIPERDHYVGREGFKRFSGLAVGWSADSTNALAIYEGRWSDESILWINPLARTFIEILPQLDEAYRGFLKKKEKIEEAGEISFSMPALLPGDILFIDGRARPQVNKPKEYNYHLKVYLQRAGEKATCGGLTAEKISSPPVTDARVELEMESNLRRLGKKLPAAERAALMKEQERWLAQRASLKETGDRKFFTRLRSAFLRARAEME
jgi:hypothetical protein